MSNQACQSVETFLQGYQQFLPDTFSKSSVWIIECEVPPQETGCFHAQIAGASACHCELRALCVASAVSCKSLWFLFFFAFNTSWCSLAGDPISCAGRAVSSLPPREKLQAGVLSAVATRGGVIFSSISPRSAKIQFKAEA